MFRYNYCTLTTIPINNKVNDVKSNPHTTNAPVERTPPEGYSTTLQYIRYAVRDVFKTTFKKCNLGEKCLLPDSEHQTMIFCKQCREWVHKVCTEKHFQDKMPEEFESFQCGNCG